MKGGQNLILRQDLVQMYFEAKPDTTTLRAMIGQANLVNEDH